MKQRSDLGRSLAGSVDHFGEARSEVTVGVCVGEPELAKRKIPQLPNRSVDRRLARFHAQKQVT